MKKFIIVLTMLTSSFAFGQKGKWVNIFDGKSTAGWHSWKSKEVKGWTVENGILTTKGKNGDLLTDKEYENYILEFEFKVQPKGNSGLIYKVIEDPENKELFAPYASGPEFQIIDDVNYPEKIQDKQKTGANYDIYPPKDLTATKPAGEWNKGKLIIKNDHIEHWLNGKKVADYEYGSEIWKNDVAGSKFAKWPYAKAHAKGRISLQDHGDSVSFKTIRIKEL
jgi:hypothetical protein